MKPARLAVFILILATGYSLLFPSFEYFRDPVKQAQARDLILPPPVVKLLVLEFRTVAADFLFSRASQYYGGRSYRPGAWSKGDYVWLYNNLLVITELDPYFEDPYYFGNAVFTWGAGAAKEANSLLERGVQARAWDWQLPFFIGFNKFYFLNDNEGGASYLSKAAQRNTTLSFLPTLAARLYSKFGKTEVAIVVLTDFWKNERNAAVKKNYEVRLDALKKILFLEKAVQRYQVKTGKKPVGLTALIRSGLIQEVPKDPYGGVFYLDKDGSIQSTSKLVFPPAPPKKQGESSQDNARPTAQ